MLEQLEQMGRALGGRERLVLGGKAARAADVQHLEGARDDELAERAADRMCEPVDAVVAARSGLGKLVERAPVPLPLEGGGRRADLRFVQEVRRLQRVLLDGAVRQHRNRAARRPGGA